MSASITNEITDSFHCLFQPLAYLGAKVLGIDQVSESIHVATAHVNLTADRWKHAKRDPPSYENVGLDEVASRSPAHYDAVIMSELLEHVTDWESMLRLANVCLKVGRTRRIFIRSNKFHYFFVLASQKLDYAPIFLHRLTCVCRVLIVLTIIPCVSSFAVEINCPSSRGLQSHESL